MLQLLLFKQELTECTMIAKCGFEKSTQLGQQSISNTRQNLEPVNEV